MDDFRNARMAMIDSQLRSSGVSDRNLLRAFADLPRECFVAEHRSSVAYVDDLQPVGNAGRFILSPAHFGRMAQLAKIGPGDRVLDLGAATGYSTAVLAALAAEVVGLEFDAALVPVANELLNSLEIANVRVLAGNPAGLADETFDVILAEGALDAQPDDLIAMLRAGGRLVAPVLKRGVALVHVFVNAPQGVIFTSEFDATMPRLWNWAREQEFVF